MIKIAIKALVHVYEDGIGKGHEVMTVESISSSEFIDDEINIVLDETIENYMSENKCEDGLVSVVIFADINYTRDYFGEVDMEWEPSSLEFNKFSDEDTQQYWK
jgi:hypothetical protein